MYNTAIHINLYGHSNSYTVLAELKRSWIWKKLFERAYCQALPQKFRKDTLKWSVHWGDRYFITVASLYKDDTVLAKDFDFLMFPLTLPNLTIGCRWLPTMNIQDIENACAPTLLHRIVNRKIDRIAARVGVKQESYLGMVYYGM